MVASVEPTVRVKVRDRLRFAMRPSRLHVFRRQDRGGDLTRSLQSRRSLARPDAARRSIGAFRRCNRRPGLKIAKTTPCTVEWSIPGRGR